MSWTEARAPEKNVSSGTGISFGLTVAQKSGRRTARLNLTAAAQERLFDGPIVGKPVRVSVGRGSDAGKLRLELLGSDSVGEGVITAAASVKGSARIFLRAWDLLGETARPSEQAFVVEVIPNGDAGPAAVLQLPSWSKGEQFPRAAARA